MRTFIFDRQTAILEAKNRKLAIARNYRPAFMKRDVFDGRNRCPIRLRIHTACSSPFVCDAVEFVDDPSSWICTNCVGFTGFAPSLHASFDIALERANRSRRFAFSESGA